MRGYGEQAIINLRSVLSVPRLPALKQSIPSPKDKVIHAEVLRGISFPDVKGKVELLIGADVPEAHRTLEYRINSLGGPNVVKSPLGWSLVGPTTCVQSDNLLEFSVNSVQIDNAVLHQQSQKMYDVDFVTKNERFGDDVSVDDSKESEAMEKYVPRIEGQYQIAPPWKSDSLKLPDNKFVAVRRLACLRKRFKADTQLYMNYQEKMNKYVKPGYAHKIPKEEIEHTPEPLTLDTQGQELRSVNHVTKVISNVINYPMARLLEHYSCFARLRNAVAWLRHCKCLLLAKVKNVRTLSVPTKRILTTVDLEGATTDIIKLVQRGNFPNELSLLEDNENFSTIYMSKELRRSPLRKLCPVKVKGVLRVGGRLRHSNLPLERKYPVLLPARDHVTELIIAHYHEREGHAGPLHTLCALQEFYWIIKGHATVRRVVGKCLKCKIKTPRPSRQIMAPLPKPRVSPGKPAFTCVGVDYAGPYMTKVGRRCSKRYLCLFVCMATRAVHLECAYSLDMDSFILAFQRFSCRRCVPTDVYSDNGTNFTAAERELRLSVNRWNQETLLSRLAQRGIRWHFNPPAASHRGGSWERIVRSVKRTLAAIAGGVTMTDETFTTFLIEVERILNGRPITKVAADSRDVEALTPNALLKGYLEASLPMGVFTKADGYRKSWRLVGLLSDQFWSRWLKEYLPLLQQRQKWLCPERNLSVNDLVLIIGEQSRRGQWPKGIIEETYPGPDGLVRSARVRTESSSIVRDIRKLCLLEGSD